MRTEVGGGARVMGARVLCVWPPSVPTYFNPGHRLPLWEVAAYLRREIPDVHVDAMDAGALNVSWKEMADTLSSSYDVVAIVNEFDNVDGVRRLLAYVRAVSPKTRVLSYGRVSSLIPEFFRRYELDGVVRDGDFEAGVRSFVELVLSRRDSAGDARGLLLRRGSDWVETPPGRLVDAAEWAFPSIAEVPLDAYTRLSSRPANRFASVPGKRELAVSISRGCSIGCRHCLVPAYQGSRERRRPVAAVIEHIRRARDQVAFDYVSMFAPTFTLSRSWVRKFCSEMGNAVPWKCCTSISHLDEDLVRTMAGSGCIRISVGLETLDLPAQATLPRAKQIAEHELVDLARWCEACSVELNCFVMVGMPGQSRQGLKHSFEVLRRLRVAIRPTIYTPYQDLTGSVSEADLLTFFTRQITPDTAESGLTPEEFYGAVYGSEAPP